jgi:phosphoglycolate phosphatase-like HAD superfamily hydrolase
VADLVIFDCDGVLVDSDRVSLRIQAERISALGLEMSYEDSVCQPHRKIVVQLIWAVGEGQTGSLRATVRTNSSNRFSHTFDFKVPAPDPNLAGRSYTVAAFADFERRTHEGESVICTESVPPRAGTKWAATNNSFPYEAP